EFCRGRMGVNVELKSEASEARAHETGARVAAELARGADGYAYVSSFWWPALEAARDAAPPVRRAFIFSDSPERTALLAGAKALGLWALHPNRAYVTPELVRDAHAAGLRVNAWTVNDPRDVAPFTDGGPHGTMADCPR